MTGDDKTRREIAELTDTLRDNLDKIVQHGKRADAIVKKCCCIRAKDRANIGWLTPTRSSRRASISPIRCPRREAGLQDHDGAVV